MEIQKTLELNYERNICLKKTWSSNLNENSRLIVWVGGEGLRLFGRNGCVALDQRRHHSARSLDAQRQRGHVQKQQILKK